MTTDILANGVDCATPITSVTPFTNGTNTPVTSATIVLKFGGQSSRWYNPHPWLTLLRNQCWQVSSGYSQCGQVGRVGE